MNKIKTLTLLITLFSIFSGCSAKINNAKTETHKVWGNCGMCKKTIEKSVNKSGEAKGEWNKDTKMLNITYDSTITNTDAILKRVADVGYDNERFRANDEAYDKRPECCHYERK